MSPFVYFLWRYQSWIRPAARSRFSNSVMQLLFSLVGSSKVSSVSRIESISAGCLMWKLRETDMRTDVGDVLGVERDPFDEAWFFLQKVLVELNYLWNYSRSFMFRGLGASQPRRFNWSLFRLLRAARLCPSGFRLPSIWSAGSRTRGGNFKDTVHFRLCSLLRWHWRRLDAYRRGKNTFWRIRSHSCIFKINFYWVLYIV